MRHWLGAGKEGAEGLMAAYGQPAYRAAQFLDWLHGKRVSSFAAMGNLPKALRELLAENGVLRCLTELERRDASDGLTSKWLFSAGGKGANALFESVLIIEKQRSRRTVCVSSMAGCPLGCRFCATGSGSFVRNLEAGEIIEQVYRIDAFSRDLGSGMGVSHIVFMGMGEPLLNLDAVLAAASAFANPDGMALSGRRITISTAGIPEGIRRLAREGVNYRLALSLHAPNQKLREKLMPAAKRWPLPEVFAALEEFAVGTSRALTFEYCLIDDVNSSVNNARELARLASSFRCKVNLIPMNPIPDSEFRPPPAKAVRAFQETLENAGIAVTVRMEKGSEIGAACGQLRALHNPECRMQM